MIRFLFHIAIILAVAISLGSFTAWWSIQRSHGIGSVKIGQWVGWPLAGSNAADPYTIAKVTTDGALPLGAAEGIAFETRQDDDGRPLTADCVYLLEGVTPAAALWTLSYASLRLPSEAPTATQTPNPARPIHPINSQNILRHQDGSFSIAIGRHVRSGNWLPAIGSGNFRLILRLYDTPITSNAGLVDPVMPRIDRLECSQ